MKYIFRTDRGKVRQYNEDNGGVFHNQAGQVLAIVADGMGGHRAGDVASQMTLQFLQESWEKTSEIHNPDEAKRWMEEHTRKVNVQVYQHSLQNQECEGMGTTLVFALCTDSFATIANIGDSRCYILNESGFKQLTEDHSLVNELVRAGEITPEAAEYHPRKNVLIKALGTEGTVLPDIKTITFEDGDSLLLCSDGLSNKVTLHELESLLSSSNDLTNVAGELIQLANDHGGEDNITLCIVQQMQELEELDENDNR
ncbi:Stp1/IreP family PP2C-type Ser/Thr phosphatase [Mangrovibacillus cuniculi]|uniref:protein-serine/threonine phosphatase n=1 Tax=Mangrovibacillus cuniculi TaxID=2593652 RepID=A0A7S8CA98_9BACI|nr:Stp1/IreP family PP2C-type Ser/Thr phosphatase [Mangrovibacillus cuniculi]QPC46299.1 Stp1/IreP family PP2C-type Ser/Thr phosphatase [Mangrovibacillus cuniculi]